MGTYISGKELVKRIIDGERDFSGISLEQGFNLNDENIFFKLQKYLLQQRLWEEPLIFIGADLQGLQANGLYLPFIQAAHSNFDHAQLNKTNLFKANLENANLQQANCFFANFKHADSSRQSNGFSTRKQFSLSKIPDLQSPYGDL